MAEPHRKRRTAPKTNSVSPLWRPLTLPDMAFINACGVLSLPVQDRAARDLAMELATELAEQISDNPLLQPLRMALIDMQPTAPQARRAQALTEMSHAMSAVMQVRLAVAVSRMQQQESAP